MLAPVSVSGESDPATISKSILSFLSMLTAPEEDQKFNKVSPEISRRKRRNHLDDENEKEKAKDELLPGLLRNEINLNLDWVFDVVIPKLNEKDLEFEFASGLVRMAAEKFSEENLLVDLDFTVEGTEYQKCGNKEIETVVVGDVHGQYEDVLLIFKKFGRPGPHRRYIFNGDIVDRGPRSIACWLVLCALKIVTPCYLYITRGNHESRAAGVLLNSSFAQECGKMYPKSFYTMCQDTFDLLPVSYTLNKSIFIAHGGLPKDLCLNKLRKMSKDQLHPSYDRATIMALLWNDPSNLMGYGSNSRGSNVYTFGHDVTDRFLKKHNLSLMIRSHEYKVFGHQYIHQSKCLTIFSCPDYQNLNNSGAVARVDSKGNVKVEEFE